MLKDTFQDAKARLSLRGLFKKRVSPGSSPGLEGLEGIHSPPVSDEVSIECIDYNREQCISTNVDNVEAFLKKPRPNWSQVRWLHVVGVHPYVVYRLQQYFSLHTLAAEDVLNNSQRPKVEIYDDSLFMVLRMLSLQNDIPTHQQLSIFFLKDTVITFQEAKSDAWDPIRRRMTGENSRFRTYGAGYLVYALMDSVVDHLFPVLDYYGEKMTLLEEQVIEAYKPHSQKQLYAIKRELVFLRRVIWPLRDLVNVLLRDESRLFTKQVRTFIRDIYDHTIQVIDVVESFRETAGSLHELYMSVQSNRMNEIMKVLTVLASFFIPITFVAGVFGMNFQYMPELHWKYGYPLFWVICGCSVGCLYFYFRKKQWIGRE